MELHFGPAEITILTVVLGALAGAVRYVFKLWKDQQEAVIVDLKKERDDAEAELKIERDNYKSISKEAVRVMKEAVDRLPEEEGRPKVKALVPVMAEHDCPPTPEQESTALLATWRAEIAAAALQMGIPAREDEPDKTAPRKTDDLISKTEAIEEILKLPTTPAEVSGEEK